MPITHTNRKGLTYYLCKTVTQSSKPSYVVTRELKGQSVEHLPGAYIDPRSSSDCKHLSRKTEKRPRVFGIFSEPQSVFAVEPCRGSRVRLNKGLSGRQCAKAHRQEKALIFQGL